MTDDPPPQGPRPPLVPPPGTPPPPRAPEEPRPLLVPPPSAPEPTPSFAPGATTPSAPIPPELATAAATPSAPIPPELATAAATLSAPIPPELATAAADLERTTDAPAAQPLPADITPQDLIALKRFAKIRTFFAKHGHLLWWLHSAYAMTFGAIVVMYAGKGYDNARWMVVLLGLGWLVLVLFFRLFGTGRGQKDKIKDTKTKVRFYVMTLALKNLYQSMLFFLLPFYYKSATFDSPNRFFVYVLGVLALLSTVDVVFDQFLMRWKVPASIVYFFILFACLNLVLPALFPDTRTLLTLLAAAAIAAVVFFTMHIPAKHLVRPAYVLGLMCFVAAAVAAAYFGRRGIPPVPMYIASGAVGPSLLPDGRLTMHVSQLHESLIQEMHALTDVLIPGGHGNNLHHVWRRDGVAAQQGPVDPGGDPPDGTVRLRSTLRSFNLPSDITGPWSIDVLTEDDQLVGRVEFEVTR